jgi:hypothetical protein
MNALCPRDGHPRALVDGEQLDCDEKGCRCEECYKKLSEDEAREWAAP